MWVTKISVLILLPYIETHLKRNDTFVRVCSCLLDLTVTFLVINLSSISSSLGCPTTSLKSSTSRVINQNFSKFSKLEIFKSKNMSQLSKVEPDQTKFMAFKANWIIRISYLNLLISVLQPLFCQIHILEHFFYIFMHKFTLVRKHNIHDTCFNIVFLPETGISPLLFSSIRNKWSYEVILRSRGGHLTWIECDSRITRWTCTVFKDQSGSLLIKMAHTCSVREYLEYLKGWMISILSH